MIRKAFINNQVLNLIKEASSYSFPIEPCEFVPVDKQIRFISYQQFSSDIGIPLTDLISICESSVGCTFYDHAKCRYLILYNIDTAKTVPGRIRWTKAHELGHIVLGHFDHLSCDSSCKLSDKELESEADYFAATLLCPMPLCKTFGISSPAQIQSRFGLSKEASTNRWNDYLEWQHWHKKTAFESDIVRLYRQHQNPCDNAPEPWTQTHPTLRRLQKEISERSAIHHL